MKHKLIGLPASEMENNLAVFAFRKEQRAERREEFKRKMKVFSGMVLFEIYLVVAVLNFLLGGFFFYMMIEIEEFIIIWAVMLCFLNTVTFFALAIRCYYVHVKNKKRELDYLED